MKKKLLFLIIPILIIMLGVSYAFFSFENIGDSSEVITGQMYLKYANNSNKLKLSNIFPETEVKALARTDNVISFTVRGKNTHKDKSVLYSVGITYGDEITGKTRVKPEHIKVRLEKNGEVVVDGLTYTEWNEQGIWNEVVVSNTTDEIVDNYTLRVWVSEDVLISDSNPEADYSTDVWNNSYISLKVVVDGEVENDEQTAACFTYNVIQGSNEIIDFTKTVAYDEVELTLDTSTEKIEACKVNATNTFGSDTQPDVSTAQDGYESFCRGTGTIEADGLVINLKIYLTMMSKIMEENGSTKEEIYAQLMGMFPHVTSISEKTGFYKLNTSEEGVTYCKNFFMEFNGSDATEEQDGYQSFCSGTGKMDGVTIVESFNTGMSNPESSVIVNIYFGYLVGGKTFVPIENLDYDISYNHLTATVTQTTENIEACKAVIMDDFGEDISIAQDGYESFCKGTGTIDFDGINLTMNSFMKIMMLDSGMSFEEFKTFLAEEWQFQLELKQAKKPFKLNTSSSSVNSCKNVMTSLLGGGGDVSDQQDGYQSFCSGTGTVEGLKIAELHETLLDEGNPLAEFSLTMLIEGETFVPAGGGSVISADITYNNITATVTQTTENIEACKAACMDDFGGDISTAQDGYESFCRGTGTVEADGLILTMSSYFSYIKFMAGVSFEELKAAVETFPFQVELTQEEKPFNFNASSSSINSCKSVMLIVGGGSDVSDQQDGYESFCSGTGTLQGMEIVEFFEESAADEEIRPQAEAAFDMLVGGKTFVPATGGYGFSYDIAYDHLTAKATQTEENMAACKAFFMDEGDVSTDQDGFDSFCRGTGTANFDGIIITMSSYMKVLMLETGMTLTEFQAFINEEFPFQVELNQAETPFNFNDSPLFVDSCKTSMTFVFDSDTSDQQDGYQSFCEGTGTIDGLKIVEYHKALLTEDKSTAEFSLAMLVGHKTFVPAGNYDVLLYNYSLTTLNSIQENVEACKMFMTGFGGDSDISKEQDGYQSFCEGTGHIVLADGIEVSFEGFVNYMSFGMGATNDQIVEVLPNISNITNEDLPLVLNTSPEATNSCMLIMSELLGDDVSDDELQSFCNGTGTIDGLDIFGFMELAQMSPGELGMFAILLVENGTFTIAPQNGGGISGVEIIGYDESCGRKVIILASIDDIPVTSIASNAFYGSKITEVVIPSSVVTIGDGAFFTDSLSKVTIEGEPTLGTGSFKAPKTFSYGGTCETLNSYSGVFSTIPPTIITSNNNACLYSGS